MEKSRHAVSLEKLAHFKCGACGKWWAIGDAPAAKREWFCPWCGALGRAKKASGK
jgi:hypothetical protein